MSAHDAPTVACIPAQGVALDNRATGRVGALTRELVLPWPDRKLHPNARDHWSVKSEAAKIARRDGNLIAREAGWNLVTWPDGPLHVWIDGYAKDRRRRDADGLLSSLKPWLDGIADAMKVDDSRFIPHPWVKPDVRKPGEVRIRITGVDIPVKTAQT